MDTAGTSSRIADTHRIDVPKNVNPSVADASAWKAKRPPKDESEEPRPSSETVRRHRSPTRPKRLRIRKTQPMYREENLTCNDCHTPFVFTIGEQEFYASKGFANKPTRCVKCRAAKKASRNSTGGGYDSRPTDNGTREMFEAICSTCGKSAQIPFQPRGEKPVYCRECFTPRQPFR